ncbi:hypothetical protein WA026_006066 [Henosepilachna vigintioctopunctata]
MNVTQICVNETKCGYARFIEKREEQHLPDGHNKSILTVTVKKGCMEYDYCTKLQQSERGLLLNFTQCIFCDQDLCSLEYPLLCMECNEAIDEDCAVQTSRIVTCGPQQVCYEQRDRLTYKLKRGCIEPSKCLKKNLCQYCNTDLCRIDARWPPSIDIQMKKNEVTYEDDNFYENASRALHETHTLIVILIISSFFFTIWRE